MCQPTSVVGWEQQQPRAANLIVRQLPACLAGTWLQQGLGGAALGACVDGRQGVVWSLCGHRGSQEFAAAPSPPCVLTPARPPAPPCAAGVKLSVFDGAKKALTTAEQAYDEECRKLGIPPPVREEWRPRGRANANGAKAAAGASSSAGKLQPART